MTASLTLPGASRIATTPAAALRALVVLLLAWREGTRQRRALAALDDRLLRDIGLSRTDAVRQTSRSFWSF